MMSRPISKLAPGWWDYTTLDDALLKEAASLEADQLPGFARDGFQIYLYDSLEELFNYEALEYIEAWTQSTPDNPAGICGPIGPIEQLPMVAQMVNHLDVDVRGGHFWGMDEWFENGKPVSRDHPLSFVGKDYDLCFNRMHQDRRMPDSQIYFPTHDLDTFSKRFDDVRCVVMQGGQGDIKHWAFNDPPKREGAYQDEPPKPEEYCQQRTRVLDLHPVTCIQNARTSAGGYFPAVPSQAATVGPEETFKAERVSIYHPGYHDNPLGIRLTTLMLGKQIRDAAVPMSLLAAHPNVQFHIYRGALGAPPLANL
jgi:glucosamine-6-phosphate deaminase